MNDKPDNLIPVAQPVEPGLQTALAGILDVNTTDDIPLTRDAIDVYQGYLQTMWDRVALPLGTTATAHVFRSILLQDDRPMGPLRRYFDITEKGISLRRLEDRVGQTGSATLMGELVTLFPQLCNALDSLACQILAELPDHDSGGDVAPLGGQ